MVYFEIQADDLGRAAHFYTRVFGWNLSRAERMPVEYWRIETGDGGRGGLLRRPAPAPSPGSGTNAYVCSFEVADFDVVADLIAKHGGRTALPKFAVPSVCWRGYFLDTEGNTFGVFEPDASAS